MAIPKDTMKDMKVLVLIVVMAASVHRLMFVTSAQSLELFDCQAGSQEVREVSLTAPADCPEPPRDYKDPRRVTLRIMQTGSNVPIQGYRCLASETRQVTRCGFASRSYSSQYPRWEEVVTITPAACRESVSTGSLTIDGHVLPVNVGPKNRVTYFSHGDLDEDGSTNSHSGEGYYEDNYEMVILTFQVQVVKGELDLAGGTVFFSNGLGAPFKDGVLMDDFEGTFFWDATEPSCEERYSQIYEGEANLHMRQDDDDGMQGAIVMVANEKTEQYAGLVLEGAQNACGASCHLTHIKELLVCLVEGQNQFKTRFKPHFKQEAILLSQMAYPHLMINLDLDNALQRLHGDHCRLERKLLQAQLHSLAAGNGYALLRLVGRGHEAHVAGEVAYIIKCAPVEGQLILDYPNCTQEIPVSVNGETRFANPFTRVLREVPTVLPCIEEMPVKFNIGNEWYCMTPSIVPCPLEPKTLSDIMTLF